MKKSILCILLTFIIAGCSSEDNTGQETTQQQMTAKPAATGSGESIAVSDLAAWRFLGIGKVSVDTAENALLMSEGENSQGVTLVSPKKYGQNVIVSYKIKPLNPETVHVLMLSISDKNTGGDITVPDGYDGNFNFWTGENVQDYVFALHNAAHNRKPFITKNPGANLIAEAKENVTGERWHDIEIGCHGAHLFMKIDGNLVVEGMDPVNDGLPGGNIAFRIRGVPGTAVSILIKDVVIKE